MTNWKAEPFTRLRGTVKDRFDEEIAALTFWTGPNQSGKSGRIIGARYALLGTGGWSLGIHGSAIATLGSPTAELFFSELEGPSGKAKFQVTKEGGEWREPDKHATYTDALLANIPPAERHRVMPLVTMGHLLDLGSDLGRRALMKRFGDADSVPEPLALQTDQRALWDKVRVDATKKLRKVDPETRQTVEPDPSEILIEMAKMFGAKKREEGKQIAALEKAYEERGAMLTEVAAGAEQLPMLRTQLGQATAWEAVAHIRERKSRIEGDKVKYREARAAFASPDVQAKRASDEQAARDQLVNAQAAIGQQIAALEAEVVAQLDKLSWGSNLIKTLERAGPSCPLCKTCLVVTTENMGQLMQLAADLTADASVLRSFLLVLSNQAAFDAPKILEQVRPAVDSRRKSVEGVQQQVQERRAAWDAAGREVIAFDQTKSRERMADDQARARLSQEHARIVAADQEVTGILSQTNAPASYSGPTAALLQAQIKALEDANAARTQLEKDVAALRKQRDARQVAKDLEEDAKKLLDSLLARLQSTAEAAVNRYMPPGLIAWVNLEKNSWNVLDAESRMPRDKHTMCGFEHDSLVPALAAAYTEGSPLRVLALDDPDLAGIGLENAERFFGSLAKAQQDGWLTQILVAGNRFEPVLDKIAACGFKVIRTERHAPINGIGGPYGEESLADLAPPPPALPPPASVQAPTFAQMFSADGIPRL